MGCNIFMCAERRIGDKWISVKTIKNDRGDIIPNFPFHFDGNYALYGFLAGVRDDYHNCYFKPRGFPTDASKEVKDYYWSWKGDAHTPSWLMLEELNSINWNHVKIKHSGCSSEQYYLKLKKLEKEDKIDYVNLIETRHLPNGMLEYHFDVKEPASRAFSSFLSGLKKFNSEILELGYKPSEIRVVFWFC